MEREQTFWLFVAALVFFAGAFARNIYKLSTAKTNTLQRFYGWAVGINLLFVLSLVFALMGRFDIFGPLFLLVLIVSIFRYKKSMNALREETHATMETIKTTDVGLSDLFTSRGWIKMAMRYGTTKALFIIFVVELVLLGVGFYLIQQFFYSGFTNTDIITYTIVLSIFGLFSFYQAVKKNK